MARNLTSGFLSVFGGRLGVLAVSFVSTPLLVRLLSPGAYGDYQFLLSVFAVFMIFVSSGVTEGVQKFVGERERYRGWREHVVGVYFLIAVLLGALGAACLVAVARTDLLSRLGAASGDTPFGTYFLLLAALVLAAQFRSFSRRTLMGFGLERYSEPLRVLGKLVWVGVGVGLAALGYGVVGVLIGHVVSSLAVAVIGFGVVARRIDLRRAFSRPREGFPYRELLSFNAMNVLLVLLLTALYKTDVVMIRLFVGDAATGYYSAALVMAEYLWFVPATLQSVFLHSASGLFSEGRTREVNAIAARVTRYTLLVTSLFAVGIAALAGRFVPLYYGADYGPAVAPLFLLLPGAVGFAVARPLYGLGQGKGDLRPLIAATGSCALVNVALNVVLIPRYGIAGAAVATSVGYGSMVAATVLAVRRLGVRPLSDLRPLRVAVTVLSGGVAVFALSRFATGTLAAFTLVPVGGAIAFGVAALGTGALSLRETAAVVATVPGPVGALGARFRDRLDVRSTRPGAVASRVPQLVVIGGGALFLGGVVLAAATGGAVVPHAGQSPATPTPSAPPNATTHVTTTEQPSETTGGANGAPGGSGVTGGDTTGRDTTGSATNGGATGGGTTTGTSRRPTTRPTRDSPAPPTPAVPSGVPSNTAPPTSVTTSNGQTTTETRTVAPPTTTATTGPSSDGTTTSTSSATATDTTATTPTTTTTAFATATGTTATASPTATNTTAAPSSTTTTDTTTTTATTNTTTTTATNTTTTATTDTTTTATTNTTTTATTNTTTNTTNASALSSPSVGPASVGLIARASVAGTRVDVVGASP